MCFDTDQGPLCWLFQISKRYYFWLDTAWLPTCTIYLGFWVSLSLSKHIYIIVLPYNLDKILINFFSQSNAKFFY